MTSVPDSLGLAADFPAATREQWRALAVAALARSGVRDADPESALATPTYDGLTLRPLYTADDLPADFDWPALLGARADGIGWDVRQRHTDPDPGRANQAILADLENGVTSIWLQLGDSGLAIADLASALQGVYLDLAPIALDAGTLGDAAARAFVQLAADRGIPANEISGTLGLDPIGVHARTGAGVDLAAFGETARLCRDRPRLVASTVDGTAYHEAGGSDAQELAITTAVALAYLRALTEAGWSVPAAAAQLEFRYAVTADQFASIAKLRAARRIWARVGELCGLPADARRQRQHAATSRAMLTQRDPWVNMLRATLACFAAATAGADAITVDPFDSAIGEPDGFGRRIARNTQSILHDESSLARVTDPAAGSWYVESRTEQLALAAWDIFIGIEQAGGALAALDSGYLRAQISMTRDQRAAAVAHRRDPITGVSEYALLSEEPLIRAPRQGKVGHALLPSIRYAQEFEALRDRADAAPTRPAVFLAALGSRGAYSGRLGFATNLFQAGGIEPVVGTGEVAEQVAAFTASGTPVACICSSEAVYSEQAAAVVSALVDVGATQVWLAGQPTIGRPAGITGYLFAGCDALEVLGRTFDALLVAA
jgi:methylmalonyl-CoA mutase